MKAMLRLLGILLILAGIFILLQPYLGGESKTATFEMKKFTSFEEAKEYVSLEESDYFYFGAFGRVRAGLETMALKEKSIEGVLSSSESSTEPERYSETNVQVAGIDEPDIVKTDGKRIYFSPSSRYYWRWEYKTSKRNTKIINAFPVENLSVVGNIPKSGNLLLHENTLVVFSGDKLYGYDISDPSSPTEKWNIDVNDSVVSARLYNGKLYLVSKKRISYFSPCPIKPLAFNGNVIEVRCTDIYHPVKKVPVDTTYNVFVINPETGSVENHVSFVGSSYYSNLYMSENGIYLTYYYPGNMAEFIFKFLNEECKDLLPENVIKRIGEVIGYNISISSKMNEIEMILNEYYNSIDSDERLRLENEFSNRMNKYMATHKRELENTGIVKIDLNLNIKATGNIPGKILNQFSMDEYRGYFRVATTVGEWSNQTNDLYVLDENLNIVGKILDFGLRERIYAVRFIGDKGYVVTFRRIDPFFVVDLSDPKNPQLKGELKIPGYSSYLHPITDIRILGIGEENNKVKVSLFDVSSPENPKEVDKYNLEDYWSEIERTHHAFLLDKKHKIFFLPGSRGGYIFSYDKDKLELKKAVSEITAKRAIYINDYLYIIGNEKIVVLDENTWNKVKELELES